MKRTLSFLMGLVMILSCCTACNSSGSGNSDPTTGDLFGESTSISKEEITLENNCYSAGMPIAKDTVKFTAMVKDYSGLTDYSGMYINQWIKDNMNIEMEWIVCPGGLEVNNMVALSYASGNLPDLFMGMAPLGYGYHWEYIQQGKIQNLTPYIAKYAPNAIKMFQEHPQAEYLSTGFDGNIYMLPEVDVTTPRYANKMYINKAWLDNLGLNIPTTTELKSVLRAFKNNDPNGNGIADEIPFALGEDLPNGLYGPFGMSVYYDLAYLDDNQKVHYAPIEENYKRALTYYRDLYKEGLIDKDWYSQSDADIRKKASGGPVSTVGMFIGGGAWDMVGLERAANEYVVLAPIADEFGNCTWTDQVIESMWAEWFMVTSACKYPEVAVRMCDYFYTIEGTYLGQYGPPGKDNVWYLNEDGLIVFNEDAAPNLQYTFTPSQSMPHYMSDAAVAKRYTETDESKMSLKTRLATQEHKLGIEYYESVMPKYQIPKFKLSLDDSMEANIIQKDIQDYVYNSRRAFLLGEKSIENEWDAYVANLNKFGVKDYIQIMQNGYDDYVNWLAA